METIAIEAEVSAPVVAPSHGALERDERDSALRPDGRTAPIDDTGAPTIIVDADYDESARYADTVTAWLAGADNYRDALQRCGHALVPGFADWCVIDLVCEEGLRRAAVAHAEPARIHAIQSWPFHKPPDVATYDLDVRDPALGDLTSSFVIAPIVARGRAIGTLSIGSTNGWRYIDADVELAIELGRRIGAALDAAPPAPLVEAPRGAIGNLLELAALRAGRLALERREIEAPVLLERVLDCADEIAIDRRVRVTRRCELHGVWVAGDAERLAEALGNLVGHALDECRTEVVVRGVQSRDEVQISIADDGEGHAPAEIPRLFEPRRGGLGVALARAIVEAHGGMLRVASTPGGGTTFVVAIPTSR